MLWRNGQLDTRPLLVHAALDGVKEKRRQWLQQRGIADDVVWPGCCPRRVVESLSRRHITGVSEDEVAGAWATIEEDAWRVIEAHLADGAHVDETSKAGETPFEQACVWSMEVIAKRLLENNADVEELVAGRDCILPRLVEWADAELVGLLLDRNADANGWQGDHVRVLHLAARSGKLQTVELLLNRGADIAVLDGSGRSALHYAASAGRMEVAQLLLDRGSEVNLLSLDGMSPMHDASEAGYTGMTRLLLEHEADVNLRNQDEMTALHCAIRMGRAEVVALLVESGADIEAKDQFGLSPLHLAICTDNPDIAMFLMGCGADVAVVDKSGKSALHHAAEHNNIDIGSMLLEHGARVDTTDEDGMSVLHHAAKSGSAAFVSLLLEHGVDFDAVDKSGMTAVHKAAENGNLHAIGLLVCRGADVGAKDEAGMTPLHHAANLLPQVGDSQHRMEEVIDLLLYLGAEISEIDNEGKVALHWAATHGFTRRCRLLLDKGARVNSRDARGMTPLHHAAHQGRIETVALLLERGADILATEENEMTALHLVASSTTETAELRDTFAHLLEKGADIQAVDQRHRNALDCILDLPNGSIKFFHADMVYLMCARGASLSVHPPTDLDAPDRLKMGLCAAIEYWQSCFLHGESLVEIPFEIIWSGSSGVETYVSAIKMCSQSDLTHRRKICIIGPSTWGKTSLVKSVAERMPALVDQSNRTIGIDLFPFAFVERYNDGEGHRVDRHEVTCWDFAGQDIYQVAHALFFSRRTLYLLCVDMSAYANALDEALSRSLREGEAYMQRFLEDHLLKWIRAILVRLPEAQFAVVGTKSDLIQDNNRLDALLLDLKLRFGIFTNEVAVQIQMSSAAQQLLKQSLAECHVTSVAHFDKVKHARAVIEHAIVARSELSFVMPPTYMKVLDRVHEIKRAAALSGTPRDRVNQVIMPMSVFCMRMAREIPEITPEECHQIVRTLDALGDVLWYEEEAKAFQDVVILDPTIMLDIVREVVNHNYESEEGGDYDALRRDGTLRHALLMNFPLWKALNETDSELVHLFKYLLQHFHLAYPAGNVEMHSEVDLIVPAYWKTRQNSQDDDVYKSFVRRRSMLKREKIVGSAIACWQYGFPAGVSETLYENFVVQSYRPMVPRAATAAGFTMTMEGEFAAAVSYVPAVLGLDVIRIEVAASTPLLAWQEVRFFVMAMEQLLERFPGLKGVRREIVEIGTNGDVSRSHSVGEAVKVLQDAASVGRDEAFVRAKMAWIPPAFSWFVESAWTDPAKLEEIKARDFIGQLQHKIAVLEKLVVTGDQERRLPALWTFTYSSDTKTGEIRMLSDVSGVCYHLPLDVKLPSAFISRHNAWLQDGVSLLSVVTSELLSLDIVKTAIEMIRGGKAIGVSGSHIRRLSALPTKADREERIHNLIDGLELVTEQVSSLGASQSPSNSRSLLLELLRIHDASFDELQIYDLANLRCAAAKSNGAFVWAHEREIEAMQEHLILCDPPFAGGQSSLPTSPCASSGSSSSSQCETLVSIRAISVLGLEPMDWYKVICEWQLIDRKGRVVGAQRTEQARATGTEPTWLTAPSELRTVRSARILRSSSLHVALRRPHRLSGFLTIRRQMKLLGTGSMTLGDCVPSNISKVDAIELHVPVGAGSVAFEISFVELSASGA